MLWKRNIRHKLICCANISAFCEESSGDSEDARRPFKHRPTEASADLDVNRGSPPLDIVMVATADPQSYC
eukprot:7239608-Heterocapsa_arctica.AAC.1